MKLSSKYLIVGGGMAADAAVHGIRDLDKDGTITVLSAESFLPYNRPPLSKKLWTGKPLDSIWRDTDTADVDVRLETRAVAGDAASRTISDSRGNVHRYEKLLIATGGVPRHLPFADEGVIYFRSLTDYQRVRMLADRKAEFVVIGGGFIGSEIAAALAISGCAVTMIFPGSGVGAGIYPPGLSDFLNENFRDKGVTVLPGETITAVERADEATNVRTDGGKILRADALIAGIGIIPATDLATSLDLTVDNGIVVDEFLRTSNPDIYAAGDVANFISAALETRMRVEHEDNANTMGAAAGRNMAGRSERYEHLPYFYSDLFDLGYEAVGELGNKMAIVEDWKDPFRKGVVYYLDDRRVRGVLLWNTWGQIEAARQLISSKEPFSREALHGRISD